MKTTMKLCKSSFGRLIAFILCFVMTFTFIPFIDSEGTTANAETQTPTIELGDYVQMGTYYGEPILWRCVGFYKVEDDGITVDLTKTEKKYAEGYLPLMFSDKILCIKAFDANGNVKTGSHGKGYYYDYDNCYEREEYGSNCWEDSNIRCWLNSTESEGKVVWACGNPPSTDNIEFGYGYDKEAGFLTNFTENERNCMKEVSQDQLLDRHEYDNMKIYGSEHHTYEELIEDCVANFKDAYKKKITDRMFLLDVNQVHEVYQNGEELGDLNYYIGKPTAECVEKGEFKDPDLKEENSWVYWLRSPYTDDEGSCGVRNVQEIVCYSSADWGEHGVRPAFYLNLSSTNFVSGDGSEDAPYGLDAGPTVTVDFSNEQTNQNINTTIRYKNKDDTAWTYGTDDKIELVDGETYYFKYDETTAATEKNYAVTVLTIPERPDTPSITINYAEGTANTQTTHEYNVAEEINWTDCTENMSVFDLSGKSVKIRVKATAEKYASLEQTINVNQRPDTLSAPNVESKTDTTVTLSPTNGCEYKCDNGDWQDSNVFENLTDGQSYTFYQRVKATENKFCSCDSEGTNVVTGIEEVIKSATPTVLYRTFTSITLKPIEGYVYKCGDGKWQNSNEFTGLETGKTYKFYQKEKNSDDKYASEPLEINTLTYGDVITSVVGITGVTAYLVAAAKNKLISKWFLTSNGIFGKKVNSWVKNFWTNMMR